jgi:hypothetical protein
MRDDVVRHDLEGMHGRMKIDITYPSRLKRGEELRRLDTPLECLEDLLVDEP